MPSAGLVSSATRGVTPSAGVMSSATGGKAVKDTNAAGGRSKR